MRAAPLIALPLALALGLAACGKAEHGAGPGAVTADEARALREAAEMIPSEAPSASDAPTDAPDPNAAP